MDPPAQHGVCAEYAVVKGEESILSLPDSISFADGSCIGTAAATAWQFIVPQLGGEAAVRGKKIFVNGGSGTYSVDTLLLKLSCRAIDTDIFLPITIVKS